MLPRATLKETKSISPAERRRFERKRVTVSVDLRGENQFYAGLTENISEGGLFVATAAPFHIGEELDVRLAMKGRLGNQVIRTRVAWIRPDSDGGLPPGMGLEFVELSKGAHTQIREFIKTGRLEILLWET